MRILAIDYGEGNLGLAISDELQMTVRPLVTVARLPKRESFARIKKIADEYEIEKVVVGLPLRLDGSAGEAAARVEKFIAALRPLLGCEVVGWDERLTSFEAEERMRAAGLSRQERRARIDQYAALVILEDYLANRRD